MPEQDVENETRIASPAERADAHTRTELAVVLGRVEGKVDQVNQHQQELHRKVDHLSGVYQSLASKVEAHGFKHDEAERHRQELGAQIARAAEDARLAKVGVSDSKHDLGTFKTEVVARFGEATAGLKEAIEQRLTDQDDIIKATSEGVQTLVLAKHEADTRARVVAEHEARDLKAKQEQDAKDAAAAERLIERRKDRRELAFKIAGFVVGGSGLFAGAQWAFGHIWPWILSHI